VTPRGKTGRTHATLTTSWPSPLLSSLLPQLEEANDLLRAESDTAARLRKNHTEVAKSMSQLEGLNRELQEKSRGADGDRAQLEKDLLLLQSTLDSERRSASEGSEEIHELHGTVDRGGGGGGGGDGGGGNGGRWYSGMSHRSTRIRYQTPYKQIGWARAGAVHIGCYIVVRVLYFAILYIW